MQELQLKAVATLKEFTNDKGETIEYIDLRADLGGIDIKLILPDSTAKSILKNKLKGVN